MIKEFVCIVCPVSCNLKVEELSGEITVSGNQCKRGMNFGKNEFTNPMRMLTTTMKIVNGTVHRLPVISSGEVPKEKLKSFVKDLYKIEIHAPITRGDIIVENIGGTGVDIIATRTIDKEEK